MAGRTANIVPGVHQLIACAVISGSSEHRIVGDRHEIASIPLRLLLAVLKLKLISTVPIHLSYR